MHPHPALRATPDQVGGRLFFPLCGEKESSRELFRQTREIKAVHQGGTLSMRSLQRPEWLIVRARAGRSELRLDEADVPRQRREPCYGAAGAQCGVLNREKCIMETETLLSAALREAGYGPDAIGSAMPRILRILEAEDVRIEIGRSLSRKEREYVRVQLELGLGVSEIVAGMKK